MLAGIEILNDESDKVGRIEARYPPIYKKLMLPGIKEKVPQFQTGLEV